MARTDDILAKYGVTRGGAAETPAASVSSRGGAEPKTRSARADEILEKYGVSREQRDAGVQESYAKRSALSDYADEFLPDSGADFVRRMGYNAERAAAAALGAGEAVTDFLGTTLYTGVEKVASLGGLAPNALSEWSGKAADKFLDNSISEQYKQNIKERYSPSVGEEKWGNLTEAGAQMATAIATGKAAASAVGKASSGVTALLDKADDAARAAKYSKGAFGLQAAGGATNEAHDEGATRGQALTYGAAVGAMETAIESIAGGIPGMGKGKIGEIARKVVSNPTVGKILDTLGEGGEEALSTIVTPFIKRAVYNENAAAATADEIAESAIMGILLSGIAQGGAAVAGRVAGTAQEAPPNAVAQRTGQSEGVDMAESESPAQAAARASAQAVPSRAQDALVESIVRSLQPVTNKQAEAILADADSVAQLGIDTNGMTRSQQRAAVKDRVVQLQLEMPAEQAYRQDISPAQPAFRPRAQVEAELAQAREELAEAVRYSDYVDMSDGYSRMSEAYEAERTARERVRALEAELSAAQGMGADQDSTGMHVENQKSFDGSGQPAYTGIEQAENLHSIADRYSVVLDNNGKGRNKLGRRSEQAQSVIERAARGEEISIEELNAIPEVAMALEEVYNGVETYTLPNRENVVPDGVRLALERGSYSGKGPDGKDIFNGAVRRNRRIDIVTGVAGSGKSSVYSNRISREQGSRIIDTDDYRDYIPEYNGRNAALVHEEASAIKKGVLAQALTDGENILLSVVGDNAEKLAREILSFKRAGYEVHLHLNHLDNRKSIGRVVARYVDENGVIGRLVAPEIVKKMGDGPMQAYLLITGQGGAEHADTGGKQTGSTEDQRDRAAGGEGLSGVAGGLLQQAGAALTSYDAHDNDVARGEPARFLADISRPEVKSEPAGSTVGAAAAGFETPGSQSVERTSRLAETATPYTGREGEATARTREEYDRMFQYMSQTEEQSQQAAQNMLYLLVDGQPTFLMDYDPEGYQAITDSLRLAPAWNGVMTDAAMLIKRELMGRSINGEISEDTYVDWLQTMREHATASGQGVQAWAKWSRTDNGAGQATELEAWEAMEGSALSEEERQQRFQAIVMFDRRIEAAQTDADLKQIILDIARQRGTLSGLTGRQSRVLTGLASSALDGLNTAQLRQFAYSSSAALSTDATASNAGQKIKTIQILNMLSNPKTPAKNLAGNTSFYTLDAMTMRGAALLDMVLSKITGTRSVAMEGSVLGRESRQAIGRAIQMSLAEVTMDVDMGGDSRYQQGGRRTFKAGGTGVLNTNTAADRFAERVLSAIERNMGYLMTTTDEAYKGAARSTQQATQRLVDTGKIANAGRDYAADQAETLARYRTFQNDGKVASVIRGVHDLLNIVGVGDSGRQMGGQTIHSFGLGDLVAPFTRVAGNLAAVGMDYSPVNAVKGTVEILDTVRRAAGGSMDPARQAKAVSDFARGMTGSAIAYGVMVLAKAGLIKRAEDEEDEDIAALNQTEGMMGTQVNIDAARRWIEGGDQKWIPGDTLIDMSNLEPLNFIVSLGVELADNPADSFLSTFGDVNTYKDAVGSAAATAGDLPILSSVGDFATDVLVYHNDPMEAGAEMLGKTAISSVTPNILAAFAKGWDEKQRSTYSGEGVQDVLVDTIKSRIPGLREQLPTVVNTLGEEKDNPGTLEQRLLNAMINPIGVNEYSQSAVSQEMERVREETGETGFYPTTRKPDKLTYTDKDGKVHEVELDYDQKQKFQATCSAVQMSVTADMIGSSLYRRAGEKEQAALLERCYDFAYQQAKAGVLGSDAADGWVRNAQTARKDLGISTTDYLVYYEKYGSGVMGGNGYDKTKRMVAAGLTIDQWADMKGKVDADGNGSVKKAEVTDYIEANFRKEKWRSLFDAYKGGSNWKNPY